MWNNDNVRLEDYVFMRFVAVGTNIFSYLILIVLHCCVDYLAVLYFRRRREINEYGRVSIYRMVN